MSQTLDKFFKKFQDRLQTWGDKINLNGDYNKDTSIIATTQIIMNKNIWMYSYSNTVPESRSPTTSEVETIATSSIISHFQSDSECYQSIDSLPPSPKHPRIGQEAGVLVAHIDIAYMVKIWSLLTEHEKYNFYCYNFTPWYWLQVSVWRCSWISTSVFEKVQLVDLQIAREWWVLSSLCALC